MKIFKFPTDTGIDDGDNKSDSSGGEMFAVDRSETNSNYTDTSIKPLSNDGASSTGSGFSYLRNKNSS